MAKKYTLNAVDVAQVCNDVMGIKGESSSQERSTAMSAMRRPMRALKEKLLSRLEEEITKYRKEHKDASREDAEKFVLANIARTLKERCDEYVGVTL